MGVVSNILNDHQPRTDTQTIPSLAVKQVTKRTAAQMWQFTFNKGYPVTAVSRHMITSNLETPRGPEGELLLADFNSNGMCSQMSRKLPENPFCRSQSCFRRAYGRTVTSQGC
jgi:hypothetical protein